MKKCQWCGAKKENELGICEKCFRFPVNHNKLIRHKWIPQDGFRIDKCQYCPCIRKWDAGWKRLVYLIDGIHLKLQTPSCKRIMHCDKVLT